jgi:hypothetical protein
MPDVDPSGGDRAARRPHTCRELAIVATDAGSGRSPRGPTGPLASDEEPSDPDIITPLKSGIDWTSIPDLDPTAPQPSGRLGTTAAGPARPHRPDPSGPGSGVAHNTDMVLLLIVVGGSLGQAGQAQEHPPHHPADRSGPPPARARPTSPDRSSEAGWAGAAPSGRHQYERPGPSRALGRPRAAPRPAFSVRLTPRILRRTRSRNSRRTRVCIERAATVRERSRAFRQRTDRSLTLAARLGLRPKAALG